MKLTPLNIVTSLCLVIAGLLLFDKTSAINLRQGTSKLLIGACLITAIITFLTDLLFRKLIPLLGRLWVIECTLIAFTVVSMVIIKTIFFN